VKIFDMVDDFRFRLWWFFTDNLRIYFIWTYLIVATIVTILYLPCLKLKNFFERRARKWKKKK
jgi:hypothetical protein